MLMVCVVQTTNLTLVDQKEKGKDRHCIAKLKIVSETK
jgi:hypothetical protein